MAKEEQIFKPGDLVVRIGGGSHGKIHMGDKRIVLNVYAIKSGERLTFFDDYYGYDPSYFYNATELSREVDANQTQRLLRNGLFRSAIDQFNKWLLNKDKNY